MTDPVDIEALRDMGAALTADGHLFGARIIAAADEVDRLRGDRHRVTGLMVAEHDEAVRLRAAIENAPHDYGVRSWCRAAYSPGPCTCWKADVR